MLSASLWSLLALLPPQGPIKIGVIAVDKPESPDLQFLQAARLAVAGCNLKGGVLGAQVELVVEAAASPGEVAAAVTRLDAAAVVAIVAPPETRLGDVVRRATQGKVPCAGFASSPAAIVRTLDALLARTLRVQRIAFVREPTKEAHELGKLLQKGLQAPTELLWECELGTMTKALQKRFEEERPELLLIDGEPEAVATFLVDSLGKEPMPVVLTPRALGPAVLRTGRDVFAIAGQSPVTLPGTGSFRADFEKAHGPPLFGAAEGFEAVRLVLRAIENAKSRERPAIRTALPGITVEGARGAVTVDKTTGALDAPLAVWRAVGGRLQPYVPMPVNLGTHETTAGGSPTGPSEKLGVPFGTFRTRDFAYEAGSQVVHCRWADDGAFATAQEDLALLGLSTGGAVPIVDHLVRDEILARIMAITSGKYGRQDNGTGVAGKSLKICFIAYVPEKERKKRIWLALHGGDHPDAGGEAFGSYCRVYTAFIRKTIFQKNALKPPLSATDLELLDGTYRYGTDIEKDRRSELLRALVNSYSGSMALTLSHEVGHLCGLEHVTDDPKEIMNVDEGAGIDYREGHFGPYCWGRLIKKLGLVGDKR